MAMRIGEKGRSKGLGNRVLVQSDRTKNPQRKTLQQQQLRHAQIIGCVLVIMIVQEFSVAHNPQLKAGARCAHIKMQNELPT